jgi:hypothetical protein
LLSKQALGRARFPSAGGVIAKNAGKPGRPISQRIAAINLLGGFYKIVVLVEAPSLV